MTPYRQTALRRSGESRGFGRGATRLWHVIPAFAGVTLILLAFFLATPVHAQTFPKFTGFVVDAANVIPDAEEAELTAQLDALQQKTGRQLVVATIPNLEGYDIADYGYRLGRAWAVGLKDVNNGAILIVAPNDRKVRVEVGYGLEPVLTDAFSSVVINSRILPAFKAGDLPGGIRDGTAALVEQLSLPDEEAMKRVREAVKAQGREGGERHAGIPLPLIFWGLVLAFVLLSFFRGGGGGGGGGRRRRRDGSSVWMWAPVAADILSDIGRSGGGRGSGWSGGGSSVGGGWMGGGFGGGGGGSFGGGGASGSW